jgi:hypothetical protein
MRVVAELVLRPCKAPDAAHLLGGGSEAHTIPGERLQVLVTDWSQTGPPGPLIAYPVGCILDPAARLV